MKNVAWALLIWLLPLSQGAGAALTDGVVAAIDYKIISLSTLVAYRQALDPQVPLSRALDDLLSDRLLATEGLRYGQSLGNQEVSKEAAPIPQPTELNVAEWHVLLADHLLAERFLNFRFGGFVPVTMEQLQSYYQAHRATYTTSFANASQAIRDVLTPQLRAQQEAAYIQELRTRANVRVNPELLTP
jgi:hypothetical protein